MVSESVLKTEQMCMLTEQQAHCCDATTIIDHGKEQQLTTETDENCNNNNAITPPESSSSTSSGHFGEGTTTFSSSSSNNAGDHHQVDHNFHYIIPVLPGLPLPLFPRPPSLQRPRPKWARRKYSPSFEGLHDEIMDLYTWLKPTAEEIGCRWKLFKKISAILKEIWPSAEVRMFGSVATNSFLPSSDIDICIMTGDELKVPDDLNRVADLLRKFHDFEVIKVLDKAAVPIVKCLDREAQLHVDVNFNLPHIHATLEWIQEKMACYSQLEPLLFVLKQFLAQRGLNNPYTGGLASYGLIVMIVFFIKHCSKQRQNDEKFNQLYEQCTRNGKKQLGLLLHQFLYFFAALDCANFGIKTDSARILKKSTLAKDFGTHVYSSGFWVSDPVQRGNNLGKSAHNIMSIKQAFREAHIAISQAIHWCAQNFTPQQIELYYYGPILHCMDIINDGLITARKDEIEKARRMLFGDHWDQQGQAEERNTSSSNTDVEEAEKEEEDGAVKKQNGTEEEHEQSMASSPDGAMHNSSSSYSGGGGGETNTINGNTGGDGTASNNSTSGCFT